MQGTQHAQTMPPAAVPLESTINPQIKTVDGVEQRRRERSYVLTEAQQGALNITFQNYEGNPYDLTSLAVGTTWQARLRESVNGGKAVDVPCSVTTPTTGTLTVTIPSEVSRIPGIYDCQISMLFNGNIIQTNQVLIYIAQGIGNTDATLTGPPSLMEIRLQLMDTSPDENLLLDGFQFTDEEIAIAVIRPLQYFNEVPPDIGTAVSTAWFPWRYHWLEGIAGQLFLMAAEKFRKNQLQYQGGGLSVADMDKERNYLAAGQEKWNNYRQFVMQKKSELNQAQFWGCIGSIHDRGLRY